MSQEGWRGMAEDFYHATQNGVQVTIQELFTFRILEFSNLSVSTGPRNWKGKPCIRRHHCACFPARTRGQLTLKCRVLLGYCSRDGRYLHLRFTYSFHGIGHELEASCMLSTLPLIYAPSPESRVKS